MNNFVNNMNYFADRCSGFITKNADMVNPVALLAFSVTYLTAKKIQKSPGESFSPFKEIVSVAIASLVASLFTVSPTRTILFAASMITSTTILSGVVVVAAMVLFIAGAPGG